jgi:ribosomal protein L12E/L44/L45/RPP1/RPP2
LAHKLIRCFLESALEGKELKQYTARFAAALALVTALACGAAQAQTQNSKNFAPGFTHRVAGTTIVVVPPDMELFSLSAGGIAEPRADWTAAAQAHFKQTLDSRKALLGARAKDLTEADMDELAQINALHAAVAQSVSLHHITGGNYKLPTKNDQLDWSLGDAVKPLRDKTGADYALFFWVRDSYASAERKAAMVVLAIAGIGVSGGIQLGYASLVDLRDGRVVWFNRLTRGSGDLREAKSAEETVDTLLANFPPLK